MEKSHSINGVSGRYFIVKNAGVRADHCHDSQKWISESRPIQGYSEPAFLRVEIRHDDSCKNGHNSFAITGDIRNATREIAGGCLHDDIVQVFPELAGLIKWHLSSTDQPMHYVANTLYWLGYQGHCDDGKNNPPNLEYARKSAVWPDLPESFICPIEWQKLTVGENKEPKNAKISEITKILNDRLENLLSEFRVDVEGIGFEFVATNEVAA